MIFNLPPICGLFPLLLYIVLAFKKGMHPLVNVSICAVVGAIMVKQPLNGLGAVIYESMGSFLALVGFIIMLGSGLGMVLRKTGVAAAIVNVLMRKIGVRTQKRAMIATMVCSVVLVTLLGKIMGLYRDRLLAIHYSVGVEANAFFTASRIPPRWPSSSRAPVRPDCSSAPSPRLW